MKANQEKRKLYISSILKMIPDNIQPVDFLMDILDISRESVYRRLRCQVPFTYDEMVELSLKLNFSLDETNMLHNGEKAIFSFNANPGRNIYDYLLQVLVDLAENIKAGTRCKRRYAINAMNHLWFVYTIGHANLSHFTFYKWLHETNKIHPKKQLYELGFPDEINELQKKISQQIPLLNNSTHILDENLFLNTIKEIQYYYRRRLIDREQLYKIETDLEDIINEMEKNMLEEVNEHGMSINYYISNLKIKSNSLYSELDNKAFSYFYLFGLVPIKTPDEKITHYHKKTLEALKKSSVLISGSNEALQIDFFNKQKRYLENLIDDKEITS